MVHLAYSDLLDLSVAESANLVVAWSLCNRHCLFARVSVVLVVVVAPASDDDVGVVDEGVDVDVVGDVVGDDDPFDETVIVVDAAAVVVHCCDH